MDTCVLAVLLVADVPALGDFMATRASAVCPLKAGPRQPLPICKVGRNDHPVPIRKSASAVVLPLGVHVEEEPE